MIACAHARVQDEEAVEVQPRPQPTSPCFTHGDVHHDVGCRRARQVVSLVKLTIKPPRAMALRCRGSGQVPLGLPSNVVS